MKCPICKKEMKDVRIFVSEGFYDAFVCDKDKIKKIIPIEPEVSTERDKYNEI